MRPAQLTVPHVVVFRSKQNPAERKAAMITFDTTPYTFSHGKQPRGEGSWGFQAEADYDGGGLATVFWAYGTLTVAKAAARKHFAGATDVVVVCP